MPFRTFPCLPFVYCVALSPALICWASAWPAAQLWKAPRHLWFPLNVERHPLISCFNIQEAGGEEERGIDQSGLVKVSRRRRGDERGQGTDGGNRRWKGGEREGLNVHANYRTLWLCVCVCLCFLRFLLIELLNVQYSAFRLMAELIFLVLLRLLCVYVHVSAISHAHVHLCSFSLRVVLCVWLSMYCLTTRRLTPFLCFRGAVCELGGGMTCLAGLMVRHTYIHIYTHLTIIKL